MSTSPQADGSALKRTAASLGLVLAAFAVATAAGFALFAAEAAFDLGPGAVTVLNFVVSQAAFVVVAVAFLALLASSSLVNFRVPDGRELLVAGGGLAVAIAAETVRQLAIRFTALSEAGTVAIEEDIATWALAAVLVMVVLVAPIVEELFFRGIVQGWVANASSVTTGIAVATALFVPVHFVQIALLGPTLAGAVSVVAVLVVVSIVLGVVYARTGNLVVPILVHAAYNASSAFVPYVVQDVLTVG